MLLTNGIALPSELAVSCSGTRAGGFAYTEPERVVLSILMTLFIERRDLLAPFKAGERRALEDCYRHYVASVASFVGRGFTFRSGDRTLAFRGYAQPFDQENAIQETFSRAFRDGARARYDGLQPYKNYLLAIARNLIIDDLRSARTKMIDSDIDHHEMTDETAESSAEHELLKRELADLCTAFVAELEAPEREFFRARFERGESQTEAGKCAELSHMQARTLEKKLRERFLKFMRTSGYFDGYSGHKPAARAS